MGGTSDDLAMALAVDPVNNVYTTGTFKGTADFDPAPGVAHNLTSLGDTDGFVSQLVFDAGLPQVTLDQAADQPDPTNDPEVRFTVVFSEPVTGFETGDVTLANSTAPGTLVGTVTPVGSDGTTYTLTVTGMTGSGTVVATIAAGVATDADGSGNRPSASTDNTVLYDILSPTAALSDPANGSSASYVAMNNRQYLDMTFADSGGSGLAPATITDSELEFTLSGDAAGGVTVQGAGALVPGTASTYRYPFTGAFGIGPVGVNFLAGSFFDRAGNANLASSGGFEAADMPALTVTSPGITEGNTGAVNLVFTVSLSYDSGQPVSVQYATADGTATAGKDYTAKSGTLNFGSTTNQTVTVAVLGDVLDEPDETVLLVLSNATNAKLPAGPGEGLIFDNDADAKVSISDASVTEGNAGTTNMTFTVSLSAASGKQVQAGWQTSTARPRMAPITSGAVARWSSPPARPARPSPWPSTATHGTSSTRLSRPD